MGELGITQSRVPIGKIKRAELSNSKLWLLYHHGIPNRPGTLFRLDMARGLVTRVVVPDGGEIRDYSVLTDGTLLVATKENELWSYDGNWAQRSQIPVKTLEPVPANLSPDSYHKLPCITKGWPFPGNTDVILHMIVSRGEAIILGTSSIMRHSLKTGTWRCTDLPKRAFESYDMLMATTPDDQLYLGTRNGEFGGELVTIDMRTGDYHSLSPYQDVTSVIEDPRNPGAVLFSDDLMHLKYMTCGIYRARGKDIARLFGEEAVYDLKSDGRSCWGVTKDNLLKVEGDRVEKLDCGKHEPLGGLLIAEPEPGVFTLRLEGWKQPEKVWIGSGYSFLPLLAVEKRY